MSLHLPKRIYSDLIEKDLLKKMVFLGGPRQVGKTTLSQSFLKKFKDGHGGYYNWDNEQSRKMIQKGEWNKNEPLIIFDEIHKRKGWQNLIKGIWDTWKNTQKFLITGSARLDLYRKGGDSLLGRYHYYRIHPYTLPELGISPKNLNLLMKFGGFPEPLIEQNEIELRRWHLQRISKLIRIDIRDLEKISDLDKLELLAESLQSKVSSLFSYKSFSEDLATSDKTIKRWVQILDSIYFCYLIPPLGSPKIKALKKTPKLYLWDWSQVEDESARFENLVASHLLKLCHYWQDAFGHKTELRYIRDETGRECDFVVIKDKKIIFAVECKLNSTDVSESVLKLRSKLQIPMWYQVHMNDKTRIIAPDFKILPFEKFCEEVGLV